MLGSTDPVGDVHWFWSDQYDHNLQMVGHALSWDGIEVRGSLEDRDFVAFYMKDGVVEAVAGLDRGREVRRARDLVRGRRPVDPAQLRDADLDLKTLAQDREGNWPERTRSLIDAARHDRPGPDGREHGAPSDARRPRVRGLRPRPTPSTSLAARARTGAPRSTSSSAKLDAAARGLADGARRRRRRDARRAARAARAGDIIIDGGNSLLPRRHPARRRRCGAKGIHYVDVGTSGGVFGLERGYCLMIGGEPTRSVARLDADLRDARARASAAAPRTPGARAAGGTAEQGYLHCGPERRRALREDGAQRHRVRAHGRLRRGPEHPRSTPTRARGERDADAETAPLRDAGAYQYDIDIAEIAEVWRRGSVIASWLLDLTAARAAGDPGPRRLRRAGLRLGRGPLDDPGRRSTRACPAHVLAAALFERFSLAGRGRLREPAAVGHAQGVRRPRREAGSRKGDRVTLKPRRAAGHRHLRDHRRPHQAQALPGVLPPVRRGAAAARVRQWSATPARRWTDDEFREHAAVGVTQFGKAEPSGEVCEDFTDHLSYVAASSTANGRWTTFARTWRRSPTSAPRAAASTTARPRRACPIRRSSSGSARASCTRARGSSSRSRSVTT